MSDPAPSGRVPAAGSGAVAGGAVSRQTVNEITHWRLAAEALADLDDLAPAAAWAGLEAYLRLQVRERLAGVVSSVVQEAAALQRLAGSGAREDDLRAGLLALRSRYLRAETVLDFFTDTVGARTSSGRAALLRGLDVLAGDSMSATLAPLGIPAPPALVYVDKGLGASILRAGIRLWDRAHPSPVAAIKLTRHNLLYPTAMLHETGHQVGHLTGWNDELAAGLHDLLSARSPETADMWRSCAGEVVADVHAFAQSGWAPVYALANVVDGTAAEVFRLPLGDPHPFAWIRVAFNVALCRSWYGEGPWDDVGSAWAGRHDPVTAGPLVEHLARASLAAMPDIVQLCTRTPMRAFRGAALCDVLDPRRVSPPALASLEQQAGGSLLTSSYLRRRQPLTLLTLLTTRAVLDPAGAAGHRDRLRSWICDVGADAGGSLLPTTRAA